MRRCQAPSQVAKRFGLESELDQAPATPKQPSRKRKRVNYSEEPEEEEQEQLKTPSRTPLSLMINRAPMIGSCSPVSSTVLSPHEALIRLVTVFF